MPDLNAAAAAGAAGAAAGSEGSGGASGAAGSAGGAASGASGAPSGATGAAAGAAAVAAAGAAAPAPEIKYDLKLPEHSKADPAIVERTAATARKLGLSQEAAQSLLEARAEESVTEADATRTAALDDYKKSIAPGGSEWTARQDDWQKAALADKELGNGNPETLKANAQLAQKALATYFEPEVVEFLEKSGFGSVPGVIKGFLKIARSMSEDQLVVGSPGEAPKDAASVIYPNTRRTREG